jgi:uncharacterized protein YueI
MKEIKKYLKNIKWGQRDLNPHALSLGNGF